MKNKNVDTLARGYATRHNVSIKEARAILDNVFNLMADSFADGEGISVLGKFSFTPDVHKAREALNPKTKQKMTVPEKHVIKFKLGSDVKKALN